MATDQTPAGAPAGVTFDLSNASEPAPQTAPQQAPQGVTFDDSSAKKVANAAPQPSAPTAPPQGVTFDDKTAKSVQAPNPGPATSIGPREHSMHNWFQDLQADVHNGSDLTWFGAMMKKLGAPGMASGVAPGVAGFMETANPIAAIPMGLSKLGEGGIEILHNAKPVVKYMAQGDSFQTALTKAMAEDPLLLKKAEIGANKTIGGALQTAGPVTAFLAPEATLAASPVIASAMAAQHVASETAKHFGADDDDAELIGNTVGLMTGAKLHSKMEAASFETAVNTKLNAESVYKTRAQELDIARQQATAANSRALEAAKDEWNQVNNGSLTDQQKQELKQRTDVARTTSSEAAKNADNAQKAFDQANQSRSEAGLALKKFSRTIQEKAAKVEGEKIEQSKKDFQVNRETLQKAVPAKGTDLYDVDENGQYPKYDIVRSHLEAAQERGMPVDTIADSRNAVEDGRQRIEDTITEKSQPIKDEPLVLDPKEESPAVIATKKLDALARVDENFKGASDELSKFNTTDLTIGETRDLITKLNDYMRATKKSSNNWDVYNQIQTNPKFAAQWFLADAARNTWYDRLEGAGIDGVAEARKETAALIDFRNAADAQLRRNAGGSKVRGSGNNAGPVRNLIAKLTGKTVKGVGIAAGAEYGGAPGAVLGGAIGEMIGEPIQDYIAPGDMTRDEHVQKSMKTRGTNRKPVEIEGTARPTNIPETPVPPAPKPEEGPQNIALTKRKNTDLHADLAAHYGLTDLSDRSYEDLERDLRRDIEDKKAAKVETTPDEKKLMARVLKADAADNGIIEEANKTQAAAATAPKTPEQEKAEAKAKQVAIDTAGPTSEQTPNTLDLNPHLQSLGRGDESALVSHSVAARAHSPALPIPGLPEGLSSESAHQHEWAHLALGAIDGLEPFDYISHMHPEAPNTSAARARFTVENLKDEAGNVDPDKMLKQETQYLTKKMAGPASHEIFDNLTYDDIKKMSNTAGDFRGARRVVREMHPDFSPSQVEAVVEAAYQRARNFLSNPDVANRIRANAAVREDGLDITHHASAGRVRQFAEDIRKVVNDGDENTGGDGGPDGGKSGEGSEKTKGAEKAEASKSERSPAAAAANDKKNAGRDSGGRAEGARRAGGESTDTSGGTGLSDDQTRKVSIPPERTTGDEARDAAIKKGGGVPGGVMKGDDSIGLSELSMFHDPETGTTLALKSAEGVTPEKVAAKIKASRDEYKKFQGDDQTTVGSTSAKLLEKHGESKDPLGNGFILSDGRRVSMGATDHADAVRAVTPKEEQSPNHQQDMVDYLNREGVVRTRYREGRGGKEVVFSVPEKGVSEDQISQMRQAVGKMGRYGNVVMEVAEGQGKSAQREFARPSDIDGMLHEIGAHPEKSAPKTVAESANDYNQSEGREPLSADRVSHSPETGKQIADAYEAMKHDPNDPKVKASYQAFKNEIDKQWDYATDKMGMKMEPWNKEGQPYANSKEMVNDVRDNKHLYFYQGGDIPAGHPTAEIDPKTGLSYNDKFRAVHDLFGHAAHENQFGAKGEENAWNDHRQMFPPEAIPAMTAETRGQNSWVNFGKHLRNAEGNVPAKGEEGYVSPTARPYAEQKAGLLPEKFNSRINPEDLANEDQSKGELKHAARDLFPEGTKEDERSYIEPDGSFRSVMDNDHFAVSKLYPNEDLHDEDGINRFMNDSNWLRTGKYEGSFLLHAGETAPTDSQVSAALQQKRYWEPEITDKVMIETPFGSKNLPDTASQSDIRSTLKDLYQKKEFDTTDIQKKLDGLDMPDKSKKFVLSEFKKTGKSPVDLDAWGNKDQTKGSTTPLMMDPLKVKGTGEGGNVNTLDITKALNAYSKKQNPALQPGSEPAEMVARAKSIAEDEAKYQLAQSKTGTEWYTTEMKDHDRVLQGLRPELAEGETTDAPDAKGHPVNLTLFKAAEAILSSGQKPYANVKSALSAWDAYKETGEFPRINPNTGKSWGPRGVNAYGNALDTVNNLIKEKGAKGAADWLLTDHDASEVRSKDPGVKIIGKKDDQIPGAMILGAKRGPFMQNLHGIESKFTADMWVSRTWNRWMGTLDLDPKVSSMNGRSDMTTFESDAPRNNAERNLMKESFSKTADKLKLTTSSLQAVLWYYEQALYRAHGIPVESWSFSDAAKRVAKEQPENEEQQAFNFGENKKADAGLAGLVKPKAAGAVHAFDFLNALKGGKK